MDKDIQPWAKDIAVEVNRLVSKPGGMDKFRNKLKQWSVHHSKQLKELKKWQNKRQRCFKKLAELRKDSPLRKYTSEPPIKEWEEWLNKHPRYFKELIARLEDDPIRERGLKWDWGYVDTTKGSKMISKMISKTIHGWVPPELALSAEPDIDMIPLRRRRPLRLDEKYALLAAVHDHGFEESINPWLNRSPGTKGDNNRDSLPYDVLCYNIVDKIESQESKLRRYLAHVEADLKARYKKKAKQRKQVDLAKLTPREKEVYEMTVKGFSQAQVAAKLKCTKQNVSQILKRAKLK